MKKIGVITVDYNNHKDTLEFLKSARNIFIPGFEIKIIVVDNGSDKFIGTEIEKLFSNIEVLQTGSNLGFAGGYNFGIKYALAWGADYLFVVNNDTVLPDQTIFKKLVDVFKKYPKAGMVAPKILFAPGYEFYKARYSEKETGRVIWYAGGYFDWGNISATHRGIDEVDRGQYDEIKEVSFISGCCFLAKREIFEKAGFFDDK